MAYERDILDEPIRRRAEAPSVVAKIGQVVEDRSTGFCGDIVKMTSEAVTLRDRKGEHRHYRWKPAGFLIDGKPVTLVRPSGQAERGPVMTASGSVRATNQQRHARHAPAGSWSRVFTTLS